MRYTGFVISVKDINASKKFYEELFDLEVYQDYGINITFDCGLSLQQDFDWLIIDDGSTDNTKELVQSWIEENLIPIKYHYQKNQHQLFEFYLLLFLYLSSQVFHKDFLLDLYLTQFLKKLPLFQQE